MRLCRGRLRRGFFFFIFFLGAEKVPVKMVLGSLKIMEIMVLSAGGVCIHGNQGCVMLVPGKNMKDFFFRRAARADVFFFVVW